MTKSSYEELPISSIELDIDNPRIKMYLENYAEVTAEGIALALNTSADSGQTSFSSLREAIKTNGGIINPILVNHRTNGKYVVIEGNTRLQIYKDFVTSKVPGNWNFIRCIVYEALTDDDIHSIRLQSHMVGPRDWDAYSKAKYLDYLMNQEKLPMNSIISFCGGKKAEIDKLVKAYQDMQQFYVPYVKQAGMDISYKDFSKFAELQNKSVIDALLLNGFTKKDFAKWVVDGNVDTAMNVRLIPTILKTKESKEEFLKSNIAKAMTKVTIKTENADLSSVDYLDLCRVITNKLDKIELKESRFIQSPEGAEKKNALITLQESIKFVLGDTEEN
jgi:hypothetical protein